MAEMTGKDNRKMTNKEIWENAVRDVTVGNADLGKLLSAVKKINLDRRTREFVLKKYRELNELFRSLVEVIT